MTLLEIIAVVTPFITLGAGWLAGRKNTQLEALEIEMTFYRNLVQDLKAEIEDLRGEMIKVEHSNKELLRQNQQLKQQMNELKRELSK